MSSGLAPLHAKSPKQASRSRTTCTRVRPMPGIDAYEADVLDAFEGGSTQSRPRRSLLPLRSRIDA